MSKRPRLRPRLRTIALATLVVLLSTLPPAAERSTTPVDQVAARLNPFLLTNLITDSIVIEVDWVEGTEPNRDALDAMVKALRDVTAEGKRIELILDEEIPLARWQEAPGEAWEKTALLASTLDADPSAWRERELIYVVYVPDEAKVHGWQLAVPLDDGERRGLVPCAFIYQDELRSDAALWIGPRKIERAILVHELGHALGLVANPDHEREEDKGHCTKPGCVLASRTPRSKTQGAFAALFAGKVPFRYCKRCRRDVSSAQKWWRQRAKDDPHFARDETLKRAAWEASVFAARRARDAKAVTGERVAPGTSHAPDHQH